MRPIVSQDIYDRLDELDPTTFEAEASKLLHGLGFDEKMMAKGTKDMSGALLAELWCPMTWLQDDARWCCDLSAAIHSSIIQAASGCG